MTEHPTLPEKKEGKQLSTKALQEMMRPYAQEAIDKAILLMSSTNENVALGAVKLILAKVLPDLKSTELTGENGSSIKINITGTLTKVYGIPEPLSLGVDRTGAVHSNSETPERTSRSG